MKGLKKSKNEGNEEYKDLYIPMAGISGDAWEQFRILKTTPEFSEFESEHGISRNLVIRYVNYLYSVRTPLIKQFREDLAVRKMEALKLASEDCKAEYKKDLAVIKEGLFELRDPAVLKMVMRFLILQKNVLWTSIVTTEQTFFELNEMVLDPITKEFGSKKEETRIVAGTKKVDLLDRCDKIKNRLSGYYVEFFGDDLDAINAYNKRPEVMCWPEQIAKIERPH